VIVTLADMKTRLGISDNSQDAFLTSEINIMTEAINSYCGRVFEQGSYVQTFYSDDYENLVTSKCFIDTFIYPIVSITHVKEKQQQSNGSFVETVIPATEYRLNKPLGRLIKTEVGSPTEWFQEYGHPSLVEVSYSAGFATVPLPVQEVCYALVGERYNKKQAGVDLNFGSNVQRISIPGVFSLDYDFSLQTNEVKNTFGAILGDQKNILDFYLSDRRIVGDIRPIYV